MPKLGLTMTEGTLSEWSVALGAAFRIGDTLIVIETDKVAVEVPAESDGVLVEIVTKVGDTVAVGSVVGYIEPSGAAALLAAAPPADAPEKQSVPSHAPDVAAPLAPAVAVSARIVATPLARRLGKNLSVDLQGLTGTGPRGRIRADDVRAASKLVEHARAAPVAPITVAPQAANVAASANTTFVRPTSIQSTMARRLTAAKQQIPHFYLAAEAEVSRLLATRAEVNASAPAVKLTLNHLVVAAIARALRDLPSANRVWTDDGIQSFESVDVGVAVHTDRGLLVPVVRDIGRASLAEIANRATSVVERARLGTLKSTDVGGGAITVSNAGMHEVTWMTPIINPGTAMIVGVGSIRDVFRPDAEGRPVLRKEMGLVLAADHRLVDGVAGLIFLNRVIALLRNPIEMMFG